MARKYTPVFGAGIGSHRSIGTSIGEYSHEGENVRKRGDVYPAPDVSDDLGAKSADSGTLRHIGTRLRQKTLARGSSQVLTSLPHFTSQITPLSAVRECN